MNDIICNNCVGARLYQIQNMRFDNPFMWNIMLAEDFKVLIENYDEINFQNVSAFKAETSILDENVHDSVAVNVDGMFSVHYVHHHIDENHANFTKHGIDCYYAGMLEYIENKFLDRVARMRDDPVFLFVPRKYDTVDDCVKFIEAKTKYHKVLAVTRQFLNGIPNKTRDLNNVKTIILNDTFGDTTYIAKYAYTIIISKILRIESFQI